MHKEYRPLCREETEKEASPDARPGTVWKIDRCATHDGPGMRTLLYFKGCPLRCKWCSNPEGQTSRSELAFQQSKCIGCRLCLEACPTGSLALEQPAQHPDTRLRVDRSKCNLCGKCAPACPTNALQVWGRGYSVADLLAIIERDRPIHRRSGGGITCTGGEPFQQQGFIPEFLEACHRRGIHTAVETCACVDETQFKAALELVDWLFIDLKHMDAEAHLKWTGKDNDLILSNVRLASSRLQARGKPLVIRMVVIPGVNDGENIHRLADFLCSLPLVTTVELLPYHRFGVYKYELLGRSYGLPGVEPPAAGAMEKYRRLLENRGVPVSRGTSE